MKEHCERYQLTGLTVVVSNNIIRLPEDVINVLPSRETQPDVLLVIEGVSILANRMTLMRGSKYCSRHFYESEVSEIHLEVPTFDLTDDLKCVFSGYFVSRVLAGLYLTEPARTEYYNGICLYNTATFLAIASYFEIKDLENVIAHPERPFMGNEEAVKHWQIYRQLGMMSSLDNITNYLADNILKTVGIK